MNTLEQPITKQKIDKSKVEPKKFDARLGMALSNGILKENETGTEKDYRQSDVKAGVVINQEYFQSRISTELAILKQNPKNPKVLNRVGDIYFANLKFDKAQSFFKRAFREDTDNILTANKLAESYMILGKIRLADQVLNLVNSDKDNNTLHFHAVIKMILNSLDESEKLINKISSTAANYYEAINTYGLIKLLKQEYAEAEKSFKKSIKHNKEYIPAKNNLAIAYQNQNKIDDAIKQYRSVFEMDPNYLDSYNNLFSLLVSKNKIADAYEVMVSAKHLSNQANDIQFRMGWAQMQLGNFETAITEYEKVLEFLPENSNTLNNIGFSYIQLNDESSAIDYLNRALTKEMNNPLPIKNLMELYEALGNQKQSRKLAKRLLTLVPDEPNALVFVADEFAQEEKWTLATKLYEKAYIAKPRWMSLYVSLTQIYADIFPDMDKGVDVAKFAIDNKLYNYEIIYNNLIHLYLVHDNISEAEKWLSKLIKKNSISLATLGLYNLKKGNLSEAEKYFDEAIETSSGNSKDLIRQRKHFDLGKYYLSSGLDDDALRHFNIIIKKKDSGYKYIYFETLKLVKILETEDTN